MRRGCRGAVVVALSALLIAVVATSSAGALEIASNGIGTAVVVYQPTVDGLNAFPLRRQPIRALWATPSGATKLSVVPRPPDVPALYYAEPAQSVVEPSGFTRIFTLREQAIPLDAPLPHQSLYETDGAPGRGFGPARLIADPAGDPVHVLSRAGGGVAVTWTTGASALVQVALAAPGQPLGAPQAAPSFGSGGNIAAEAAMSDGTVVALIRQLRQTAKSTTSTLTAMLRTPQGQLIGPVSLAAGPGYLGPVALAPAGSQTMLVATTSQNVSASGESTFSTSTVLLSRAGQTSIVSAPAGFSADAALGLQSGVAPGGRVALLAGGFGAGAVDVSDFLSPADVFSAPVSLVPPFADAQASHALTATDGSDWVLEASGVGGALQRITPDGAVERTEVLTTAPGTQATAALDGSHVLSAWTAPGPTAIGLRLRVDGDDGTSRLPSSQRIPLGLAVPARAGCDPRGSRTVVKDRAARVYLQGGGVFACAYARGLPLQLNGGVADSPAVFAPPAIALRGASVAYADTSFDTAYTEYADIKATDLLTGLNPPGDVGSVSLGYAELVTGVHRVAIGPQGALAWIQCGTANPPDRGFASSSCGTPPDADVEYLAPRTSKPVSLAHGSGVDQDLLSFSGGQLIWRSGGRTHRRPLTRAVTVVPGPATARTWRPMLRTQARRA